MAGSVYDETRVGVEWLASLLDTPVLTEDGEPTSGYQRVELAASVRVDPDSSNGWYMLSSGEQALLKCCDLVLQVAVNVADLDEFLAHQVGLGLLKLGSQLAVAGSEADADYMERVEAAVEAASAATREAF